MVQWASREEAITARRQSPCRTLCDCILHNAWIWRCLGYTVSHLWCHQAILHEALSPFFRQKLEARLPSLKLSLSDEKLQMLADFFKHIPVPRSSSMMGLDDSVDGHLEPVVPIMVGASLQLPHNDLSAVLVILVILDSVTVKYSWIRAELLLCWGSKLLLSFYLLHQFTRLSYADDLESGIE